MGIRLAPAETNNAVVASRAGQWPAADARQWPSPGPVLPRRGASYTSLHARKVPRRADSGRDWCAPFQRRVAEVAG